MKKNLIFGALMFAAGSLLAADSTPKDDVTAAANALAAQPNYSWTTTTAAPAAVPPTASWKKTATPACP